MAKHVLLVDLGSETRARLKWAIGREASVTTARSFADARACLLARPWDLLVTSVRLGAHNGLHLVYLGAIAHPEMRSIVHFASEDEGAAAEIRAAGAFFERSEHLARILPAYVRAILPPRDRRDVARLDRRRRRRGGRRVTDSRTPQLAASECSG
jgi:DNA-binding NtrC family response regulator